MNRPTALTVIAWLFILTGIFAVVAMVKDLLVSHDVIFDLDIIGLWIGPGLLRAEERFRRWALWYERFSLAAIPVVAILSGFFAPAQLGLQLFDVIPFGSMSRTGSLIVLTVSWLLALWEYTVLQRREVRARFLPSTSSA
jgi:hypothetical protein